MATKSNKIRLIILESIMNFSNGQKVIINPDNHPFTKKTYFKNQENKIGRVRQVEGVFIGVRWKQNQPKRHYHYKFLKIIQ